MFKNHRLEEKGYMTDQFVSQASKKMPLIEAAYYLGSFVYDDNVKNHFAPARKPIPDPYDRIPDYGLMNVSSVNFKKLNPDYSNDDCFLEAHDLIHQFHFLTGHVLSSHYHTQRQFIQNEAGDITGELENKNEKNDFIWEREFILVCDGDGNKRADFYGFMLQKNVITEKQLMESNAPLGIMGYKIHQARENFYAMGIGNNPQEDVQPQKTAGFRSGTVLPVRT